MKIRSKRGQYSKNIILNKFFETPSTTLNKRYIISKQKMKVAISNLTIIKLQWIPTITKQQINKITKNILYKKTQAKMILLALFDLMNLVINVLAILIKSIYN